MTFNNPGTVDEAVALLQQGAGRRLLAGGTDLLVQLRSGRLQAQGIVDLKRIPELRTIRAENGGFRIGAAVSGAELGEHAALRKMWPGVVEAACLIGSTQIQGRASLGGNLCNASPAADSVPALIAAGARCTVAGPGGRREVPVESVVVSPGKTSLAPGEFIVDFLLSAQPSRGGDAYLRFIPRTEMDIAVVGAGVSLVLDASGTCTATRVALGAVAPRALLVEAAGKALVGTSVDAAALDAAAAAARAACAPIDDKRGTIEFRTHVAGVLVKRAATIALERARSNA
ncbi:MAG: xanthine dehydrogenase family protein subunit M [Gammaproteobacteria bacterium]